MRDFTKDEFLKMWGTSGYLETWDGHGKNWSPEIKKIVLDQIGFDKSKISLEIGCGAGYWTNFLNEHSKKTFAIDLIPRPINIHNEVDYIENDNQQFNCNYIESESIDFVFSFGVFCHLSLGANDEYLMDILRVLKKNGKALLFYADEIGLQKFYNNQEIKSADIYGQFNNYVETMKMIAKYSVKAEKVLDFRDSLILIEKI
jgi:SAM-dependent methyltransferase